jgi:hypothetical protein
MLSTGQTYVDSNAEKYSLTFASAVSRRGNVKAKPGGVSPLEGRSTLTLLALVLDLRRRSPA